MGQDCGMDRPIDTPPDALDEARAIICGARQDAYGAPENNFERIAFLWNGYLDIDKLLTSKDVAAMMILLKVARGIEKRDNWIDIIGYAAIGADRL